MKTAIAEEQQANRWPSVSGWVVDAVNQAIDAARTRARGDLPPPPERLPHRLQR